MACVNLTLHLLRASLMLSGYSYLSSFHLCSIWNYTLDSQQGFEVLHHSSDQTVNCLILPQRPVKVPLLGLGLEHLEKPNQISRISVREFLNRCRCLIFLLYFICAFWKCILSLVLWIPHLSCEDRSELFISILQTCRLSDRWCPGRLLGVWLAASNHERGASPALLHDVIFNLLSHLERAFSSFMIVSSFIYTIRPLNSFCSVESLVRMTSVSFFGWGRNLIDRNCWFQKEWFSLLLTLFSSA